MRLIAVFALCLLVVIRPAIGAYDARVEAAQRALGALGFDPGPVDGLMGRRTRAALKAYQGANALEPSGRVDAATARALGISAPGPAPGPATPPTPPAAKTPPRLAPARAAPVLAYERLGWEAPASADSVRERSERASGIGSVTGHSGELLVSDVSQIYLVRRAGALPGEPPCRPEAGEPSMEFLVGPDGPVNFTGSGQAPLCQLGTGVVLREGMTLRMVESWWGETRVPAGRVRVGPSGLEYLR